MKAQYFDLAHKKVLITGCASGIGQAQSQAFLEQGAFVWGIDRKVCTTTATNFHFRQLDITSSGAVEKLFTTLPTLDIICNTAGQLDNYQASQATSRTQWDQILATNLTSMFTISNAGLSQPRAANQPLVFVNMASIAGFMASGGGAAYTASKHAVIGYTKQLNWDYASRQVRANCIAPGAVQTGMTQPDFQDATAAKVAAQTLIKRYAQPTEVADLTLFLASNASQYLYGTVVVIDGGFSLGKTI